MQKHFNDVRKRINIECGRHWCKKIWHVQIFIQNMIQIPTFKKKHIVQGCIYKPLIVWGNMCVCVSNIGFYLGGTYVIPMMMYVSIKIVLHIWMGSMEQWTYTFRLFIEPLEFFFPSFKIDFWAHNFFVGVAKHSIPQIVLLKSSHQNFMSKP